MVKKRHEVYKWLVVYVSEMINEKYPAGTFEYASTTSDYITSLLYVQSAVKGELLADNSWSGWMLWAMSDTYRIIVSQHTANTSLS
jgi:hypothetical protein